MPNIEVSVGVFCKCGEHLCKQSEGGRTPNRKLPYITVEPCRKCLETVKDEGYERGDDEGYNRGVSDTEEMLGVK